MQQKFDQCYMYMLWFKFILGLHFISQGARKVIAIRKSTFHGNSKSTSPGLSDTTFFARCFPLFFTRFYLQMVFTVTSSNCKVKIARFYNRLMINKK